MTFLTVPLPATTLVDLAEQASTAGHKDVARAAGDAIKRGLQIPQGRFVALTAAQLETLDTILQGGTVLNGDDLVRKVERLAGISFMHVRLPFTPGQLEDLQVRAERQGLTVEQLVERASGRIYEQFFNLIRS